MRFRDLAGEGSGCEQVQHLLLGQPQLQLQRQCQGVAQLAQTLAQIVPQRGVGGDVAQLVDKVLEIAWKKNCEKTKKNETNGVCKQLFKNLRRKNDRKNSNS